MNLDRFITIRNKVPTHFYADWLATNITTKWVIDVPESLTYRATVAWKEYGQMITVCTVDDPPESVYTLPTETSYNKYDVPMLKSLLQKCIRQNVTEQALQTAWHFMRIDLQSFIRRLCVIMIEDVILHESFSSLMWLVSATSKGYQVTEKQVKWLLGVVKYLSNEKEYEPPIHQMRTPQTDRQLIRKLTSDGSPSDKTQVLLSMMFRISYGGMNCDIDMFRNSLYNWLSSKEPIKSDMIELIDPNTLKPLIRSQILLNCADFHCFPRMITELNVVFPQYTPRELKECIWECNSQTNYRKVQIIKEANTLIWGQMKKDVNRLQRTYLKIYGS